MSAQVRPALRSDIPAIWNIYNTAVLNTTASYDLEPVSLDSRLTWFDHKQQAGWPVLVAELQGEVFGWAPSGRRRATRGR
ncbi:GNAT family N-acetyltransferase [Deinococcus aerophilus]|uniref:N-acetyltransferase domain-containing protein n=1 Tax=Deinococcus aerophilus TaxID=522488 RepID=A0ABQ2GQA2_9DEIO|nr:hypothetical protein [Deinococcus aerophilus]GGM06826.1 hypothetical protein GCM10010841_13820 [Deinococcus aerophilus]